MQHIPWFMVIGIEEGHNCAGVTVVFSLYLYTTTSNLSLDSWTQYLRKKRVDKPPR